MTTITPDKGRSRERVWKGPAWQTVGRDLVSLAVGVWGVLHEELSHSPDLTRMGFFGVLMVAPGVLAAWWLGRTGSPSSTPPSASSPE